MIRDFKFNLQRFDSAFSGGSGTENDPYKISNLADLEQLRRDVNGGTSYDGKYLKVTNDIALSDNWGAIGGINNRFRGTFDGDGHLISDFKVYHTNHDLCEGLFGYIEGATIKNVHMTNVNMRSDYYTIGSITAYASNSQVINCSVQGKMEVGGIGVHVGGLFGDFFSGTIKNCAFLGTFKIIDQVNEVGIIAGLSPRLEGNYYYGDYDNLNPNGATRIYNVNTPKGVTSSEIVTFVGKNYIKAGEVTFNYLGDTYKYNVAGDITVTLKDNKFFVNDTDLGAVFPATLDGDGSQNNPFLIKTEEQLRKLANYVNVGNNCSGLNFKLANDIALTGEWTPIGDSSNKFKGTFDGNDKTISNLTISNGGKSQGLFGVADGATIKNVHLTGVNITGNDLVGSLVGDATDNTQIINCSAQGSVKITGTVRSGVGGLVGESRNGVTVEGCSFSGNVDGYHCGGLVGYNYDSTIKNSAFLGGTINGTNRSVIAGRNIASTFTDNYYFGALAEGVNANGAARIFKITAPNNVTSTAIVTLNGMKYIKAGDATFTYNGKTYNYTVNEDTSITIKDNGLSFDKIDVAENFLSTLDGSGSENNPYLIKTEKQLNRLAVYVNYGNNCAGLNFKLANDIALTNGQIPIGDNIRPFKGNFDGNGKIISNITINDATSDYQGLFGKVSNATIKNFNLTGVNINARNNVGALVGNAADNTQIINCSTSGTIKGSENVGGIVGSNDGTIKDSAFLGGSIDGTTKGAIAGNNGGTFTDNYYFGALAEGTNDNGAKKIFNVTLPEGVTSTAIVTLGETKYITSGDATFNFNGKTYSYTVNADIAVTLQDNKFIVNNTELEANFPGNLDGSGSENNPFIIKTAEHLRQFAGYVNGGNNCSGLNFKLANDIALTGEWKPIGTNSNDFRGTFDGNGKTISNLTIINDDNKSYQGLFGRINGATIKNVKLTDVNITGHYRVGALVGDAMNNAQIINCSAQGSVQTNKFASFIGGLVGRINQGTTVDGCSFSGNIKGLNIPKFPLFGSHCGGVVGFYDDGTIKNSAFLGGSITSSNCGAITTMTRKSGTLIDNYYFGALAEGVDDNGAARIFKVTLPEGVTSTAIVTFGETNYIKAGNVTFSYNGGNYNYTVTGDVSVTIQDSKIFVGNEELKSAPKLTLVASENSMFDSYANFTTFSTSAANNSLWGNPKTDTLIYDDNSPKANDLDDIAATYNAESNYIEIPCDAGFVTPKDFTTNEFAVNNDTRTLSGNRCKV